jgi:tRNA-specific 2-thiouridylase
MSTVIVGMSGGVDSSVSAFLLKEQGLKVIGLFMKNWEEKDAQGICLASQEYEDVQRVCDSLQIPCYTVNFVQEYWDLVFSRFLEDLKKGLTPNPDVLCNKEIKFNALLKKAKSLGGEFLATGHYCRIQKEDSHSLLLKGSDLLKDQSYFLYLVTSSILDSVLFPIGHLEKKEVRALARKAGLPTAEKKDSTGICFIGERNFKSFLSDYLPYQKGLFKTLNGEIVGEHDGAAYFTIGQRKGLKIGGKGDAWFVVGKDIENNVVFIEQGQDHPALYANKLIATEVSWVVAPPPSFPFKCTAKIRYRQADQECIIEKIENGQARVTFTSPQRAITPRQAIVFYNGEICLGGGFILSAVSN